MPTFQAKAQRHLDALALANQAFSRAYPGEPVARQPVHTFYEGAHLFQADAPARLGALALASLDAHAPDARWFARAAAFTEDEALAERVYVRVRQKLEREPIEDYRIDFEDGFGVRSDDEEDEVAQSAARELARAVREGTAPPFIGLRIKSLGESTKERAARTLQLFLDALLEGTGGVLPSGFVVTLPKLTVPAQARTLVRLLELLESRHSLAEGALKLEIMIEVAQALIGSDGRTPLPDFLEACEGRCVGAHFGTYDFTASCNVTAAYQALDHPLCDLAKGMMMLAYAGTGIFLSDGATNLLPSDDRDQASVHRAWRLSQRHIRHSLQSGFFQGWDLHPVQLPVRYATTFAFFLESLEPAVERLSAYLDRAVSAPSTDALDDAATGQALLNHVLRARNAGAIDERDALRAGLRPGELGMRSIGKILAGRRNTL